MVVDDLIVAGGKVFMKTPTYVASADPNNTGPDPQNGGLFVYDPGTNTTTRITDDGIATDPQGFYLPSVIDDVLYFGAFGAEGAETWKISAAGAAEQVTHNATDFGASSEATTVFASKQFWNGNSNLDGTGDGQVYVFDPAGGTDVAITSLNAGNGGIVVSNFFEMGGALYFHATERIPGSGFNGGIFKLEASGGAVRITDESQPGTPSGLYFYFDTGAAPLYDENDVVTVDVLANDTDLDLGDSPDNFDLASATIASVVGPDGVSLGTLDPGAVTIVNNKLQFNPGTAFANLAEGQTVTVTFNYTMNDGQGLTSSSTATVVMNGTGVTGSAVDGYISSATVFADTNNNGVLDLAKTLPMRRRWCLGYGRSLYRYRPTIWMQPKPLRRPMPMDSTPSAHR